jgi:hypothetical protein
MISCRVLTKKNEIRNLAKRRHTPINVQIFEKSFELALIRLLQCVACFCKMRNLPDQLHRFFPISSSLEVIGFLVRSVIESGDRPSRHLIAIFF